MPTISIIVPIYKVEPYLRRCVDSILDQTFSDFELILVDDGSPDNCGSICEEYAAKDERVKVIHKPNGGLSSARNAGLNMAQGDYIGFVDSDDYIESNMFEQLFRVAVQSDAQIVQCGVKIVAADLAVEAPIWGKTKPGKYDGTDFLKAGKIKPWEVIVMNKLYKKAMWEGIRFPEGYTQEDEFVAHHLYGRSRIVTCIADELYNYYQSPNSIMRSEFSVARLAIFDAWSDRIAYLEEMRLEEGLDKLVYFYFDYLRYLYFRRDGNAELRSKLDEIRKNSQREFRIFLKCRTAKWTTKVATIFFRNCLPVYKAIWER